LTAALPDRRTIERALRAAGLSSRQAKRFVSAGWPALVGEAQAEVDELTAELAELREALAPPQARG
jgi:hypothetical protein